MTCTGVVSDVDGDSWTDTLVWEVNDECRHRNQSVGGFYFDKGDAVSCTWRADDGSDASEFSSQTRIVQNSLPSITTVSVSPSDPVATDVLTCTYAGYSDQDGDPDESTIVWYEGNPGNTTFLGAGETLSSGFSGGERITCAVSPGDGEGFGASVTDSVVIVNTPPTVTNLTVTSTTDNDGDGDITTAIVSDMLMCSYDYADVDGDGDQSTIEWFNGNTSLGTTATLQGVFVKNDTITCTVTPDDGTESGDPQSVDITINNALPVVSDVTVLATTDFDGDGDPSTADDTDTLSCTYTFDDQDGDSDNATRSWKVNGTEVSTSATVSGLYVGGDEVKCVVTANDGEDQGNKRSDAIIISSNSAPSVVSVAISPDPANELNTLTAVPSGWADANGDPEDYLYAWTVDGSAAGTNAATLDASYTSVGSEVFVTVTPWDGALYGSPVTSSTLTIRDSSTGDTGDTGSGGGMIGATTLLFDDFEGGYDTALWSYVTGDYSISYTYSENGSNSLNLGGESSEASSFAIDTSQCSSSITWSYYGQRGPESPDSQDTLTLSPITTARPGKAQTSGTERALMTQDFPFAQAPFPTLQPTTRPFEFALLQQVPLRVRGIITTISTSMTWRSAASFKSKTSFSPKSATTTPLATPSTLRFTTRTRPVSTSRAGPLSDTPTAQQAHQSRT